MNYTNQHNRAYMKKSDLLTQGEVMTRLNASRSTIYRLRQSGSIKTIKIGRKVYFKENDVERFLNACYV